MPSREPVGDMADFYDAEIGGARCEVLEHALDQVRADSDALKCRIDDQKIQQPRLNARDEADYSAIANGHVRVRSRTNLVSERLRVALAQQAGNRVRGPARQPLGTQRRLYERGKRFGVAEVARSIGRSHGSAVVGNDDAERRSGSDEFVKNVRASFFIVLAVGELNCSKAVALIEPPGAGIGLEGIKPNRRRQNGQSVFEQGRADANPGVRRSHGHLHDP